MRCLEPPEVINSVPEQQPLSNEDPPSTIQVNVLKID
ncbi:hypothetical protein CCACVL1_03388 [Corchorus capsularis]|uniref:Uncharacterized protein n=1 Tax=Corchorus capsularis TaxID=210143 RepID=A0A1R3JZM0_COCAP|nr:hypothetical protein CCACVL1_03388 [Corchorus capsularis]